MTNLKDRVQDLLKNTKSAEVKTICESFLKDSDGKDLEKNKNISESLFLNLKNLTEKEGAVSQLLNEKTGYQKNIMDIESEISKNAATRLMENWDMVRRDKKVNNVGNLIDNTKAVDIATKNAQDKVLLEQLSSSDDTNAASFLKSIKNDSYGVSESIEKIKSSPLITHHQLKYTIARFEKLINENMPESTFVKDYLSAIAAFKWDSIVNESYETIKTQIDSRAADIEVQNTIYAIKCTDTKRFYTGTVSKMHEWLSDEKRTIVELLKEMKAWTFNPYVKTLVNNLMMMENSKGTTFNIPVKSSNCKIDKIYSPVTISETNGQIFKSGGNFYHSNADTLVALTEEQVNALPKDFLDLCEAFFDSSIKVIDGVVTTYLGKAKVEINEGKAFINGKEVENSKLGSTLVYHTQATIFKNDNNQINLITKVLENINSICEIDFGKSVFSTLYEGVGVYLFKKADKIFINKVNPSMNENAFVTANAIQTVNLVQEFLSYNLSESLGEFLEGDYKKKSLMEKNITEVLSNIQLLEGELEKIEKAISEDPALSEMKTITDAKVLIENELNKLKSKWHGLTEELKSFEVITEKKKKDEEEEEKDPKDDKKDDDDKGDDDDDKGDDGDKPSEDPKDVPPTVEADEAADEAAPDAAGQAGAGTPDAGVVSSIPAGDVVSTGLVGAEGAQSQATEIQGNDHIDANAGAVPPSNDQPIVQAGFNGAAGDQKQAEPIQGGADVITAPTQGETVLTSGDQTAGNVSAAPTSEIPVAVGGETTPAAPVSAEPEIPATEPAEEGDAAPTADDAVVIDAAKDDEAPKKEDEEEVKESNSVSEAIGIDSKVKVDDKCGKVTAINDAMFTVVFDDGTTGEFELGKLVDLSKDIEDKVAKNEEPEGAPEGEAPAAVVATTEAHVEGDDKQEAAPTEPMYVKAKITIDFGPFKAGDDVEIDAAGYTSGGEDDPIKLKDAKEDTLEVPKKYLKVEDAIASGTEVEGNEPENLLKKIETMIKGNDKISDKSKEDALEKLKELMKTLEKDEKVADKKE